MKPHVSSVVLAANAAFDMQRRVSAHGIFSTVQTASIPYTFPAAFYIIVHVENLVDGKHVMTIRGSENLQVSVKPTQIQAQQQAALVVLTVDSCIANAYGSLQFEVIVDDAVADGRPSLTIAPIADTGAAKPEGAK